MDNEQKDTQYQTHLSGPTQGFVQGEHNTVILVSKEPERADSTQSQGRSPQPFWVRLCCWLAKQQGFVWGNVILGITLNLFATWLVSPPGQIFSKTPLGAVLGYPWGPWLLFGIGVGLLILAIVVTVVSRRAGVSATHIQSSQRPTQQDRNMIVQLLYKEYRKRLEQSLQGAAMIAVRLHERTDVIRSSMQLVFRRLSTAKEYPLPSGTSIIHVYDNAERGLLILGKPGAGKTT